MLGKFPPHNFFGDGSLYILNALGYTIGHVAALVRTTPDTAIFLGGDTCHFTGSLRPSQYIPMPEVFPEGTALDEYLPKPCPSISSMACHPNEEKAREVSSRK